MKALPGSRCRSQSRTREDQCAPIVRLMAAFLISSTLAENVAYMCGRETFTMDVSSSSSTVPSITDNAISHR
jgi:hypothetical protein